MARPKQNSPEQFTSGEISYGTGISLRNLQYLRDNALTPTTANWTEWNKATNVYDMAGFVHFSMVGALLKSGLPLARSAKMVKELRWEFNEFEFGYMSGLSRQVFKGMPDYWTPDTDDYDFSFWLHHGIRKANYSGYSQKTAWDNDIILVVADQKYALTDIHIQTHGIGTIFGHHTIKSGPYPFCQFEEHGDGVIPIHEREEWETSEGQLQLLTEYRDALDNATGVTRVNLSLALRNCADQIHDLRMEKGGKIFSQ
ncbi:MAG: hypothetical protein COB08_011650 [Rhodobacteraceae bacterium]|nr:hypothetical protein [Paracoccaceae bacterium]